MAEDIKSLYPYVPKGTFKDQAEFIAFASDPNNRRDVFSIIKSKGVFADESDFNSFMDSLKKKESTQLGSGDGASVLPSKKTELPKVEFESPKIQTLNEKPAEPVSFLDRYKVGEGLDRDRKIAEQDALSRKPIPAKVEKTTIVSKDPIFGLPVYKEKTTKVITDDRERPQLSPKVESAIKAQPITKSSKTKYLWGEVQKDIDASNSITTNAHFNKLSDAFANNYLDEAQLQEYNFVKNLRNADEQVNSLQIELQKNPNNPVIQLSLSKAIAAKTQQETQYTKFKEDKYKQIDAEIKDLEEKVNLNPMTSSFWDVFRRDDFINKIKDLKAQKENFFLDENALVQKKYSENKSVLNEFEIPGNTPKEKLQNYYLTLSKERSLVIDKLKQSYGEDVLTNIGGTIQAQLASYLGIDDNADKLLAIDEKMKSLAPAVLINRNPVKDVNQGFFESTLKNATQTFIPSTQYVISNPSEVASYVKESLALASLPEDVLSKATGNIVSEKAKGPESYSKEWWGNIAGTSVGMIPYFAVGTGLVKSASIAMDFTKIANYLAGAKYGKYLVAEPVMTGLGYKAAGYLMPSNSLVKDEATFLSGFFGGLGVAGVNKLMNTNYIAKMFNKLFGDKAESMAIMVAESGKRIGSGVGETFEETGNNIGPMIDAWIATGDFQKLKSDFNENFGSMDKNLELFVASFTMGAIMGHGNAYGKTADARSKDFYNSLSAENKKKADLFVQRVAQERYNAMVAAKKADIKKTGTKSNPVTQKDLADKQEAIDVLTNPQATSDEKKAALSTLADVNLKIENEKLTKAAVEELKAGNTSTEVKPEDAVMRPTPNAEGAITTSEGTVESAVPSDELEVKKADIENKTKEDLKNLEKQKESLTPESAAIVDQKIAEATSLLESLKTSEPVFKSTKREAQRDDVERRRQAELQEVNIALAKSQQTGVLPTVNGEPVTKRTIKEINDKYDNELFVLGLTEATTETKPVGSVSENTNLEAKKADIEKARQDIISRKSTPEEKFQFLANMPEGTIFKSKDDYALVVRKRSTKRGSEVYELVPLFLNDDNIWERNDPGVEIVEKKANGEYNPNASLPSIFTSDVDIILPGDSNYDTELATLEGVKPTAEVKPLASGDQVQLEPQMKGGMPRVMEFKDGTWQQKIGNEYTTVSKEVQQEAQNLYDSQNKQGVSGEVGIRQEPIQTKPIERGGKEAPSPSGDVQTSQKVKESGEFVVQGTFNGHRLIAGNKEFEVRDYREIGQAGRTEIVENEKGDKKIFTLITPNRDYVGRKGYMGVSLVLPSNTTKTKAEIESILKDKTAEVNTSLDKNVPGRLNKPVSMKYEGETLVPVAKQTKATPPPIPKTAVKEKVATPPPIPKTAVKEKTVTPPPISKEVTPPVKETEALTPIPEIRYENLSYTAGKKGDLDLKYQDDSKKDFWKSDGQMPPRSSMPKQMTNEDYDTLTWMFASLNTQRFIWNYLHTNPDVSFNQVYIDTTNAFLPDGKKIPYVDTPTAKKLLSEYTKPTVTSKEEAAQPAKQEAEAPKTFVREEYSPVTKKDISIPKFTKDEAIDYEEDYKEGDNGRSYAYLASVKVPVTNDVTGDDIGALAKIKDEDGNISWRAEDADGFELSDEDFDTKDEAIEAILKKHNKEAEKEHNKEQNRLAKKFEKEAAKEAAKKAKVKPEAKGKDRFMVAINKNLPADQAAEVESIINDALNDINATTSEVVNIEKTIPQGVPMTPIVVSKDDARPEASLMRDLSVPLDMIYGKTVGIGMSDTLTTGERTVPVYNTETGKVSDQTIREEGGIGYPFKSLFDYINGETENISDVFGWAAVNINAASGMINAAKKADKITGKELKAHYFKSLGLNKANLSAEQQAQKQRLEDGIPNKKEYGLVTIYKMGDDGIKSNEAYAREAFRQIEVTLNDAEKADFFEKAKKRLEQVKWEGKEKYIDKLKTAENFKEFEEMLHGESSTLNLKSKADIISRVFLSTESTKSKESKNPVGYLLKEKGISLESVAKAIEEPAMDGVLPGQMMLLLAIDPDAQTIVDTERKRHKNYPAGVVGLPVGLFEETAMFHNLSPQMMDTFVKSSTSDRDNFAIKVDPETGEKTTVTVVVSQGLDGKYKAEEFNTEIKQVPVKDTFKTVSAKVEGKEGEKRNIIDKKGNPITADSKEDIVKKLKKLGYQFSKDGLKAPYRPNISGATFNDLIQKAKSATLNIFNKPQLSPQQKLVKYLQAAFPGIVVEMSAQEAEANKSMYTDQKLFTKSGDAHPYGFIREGRIYFDPTYLNNNTPIHEFGHIWTSFAKNYRPDIYAKGVDLIKNSSYYKGVLDSLDYRKIVTGIFGEDAIIKSPNGEYIANPQSASYSDVKDYIYNEALSTAIGNKGEMFVNQAQKSAFSRWLELLFSAVKKITGFESFTDEEFKNITLNQFVNAAAKELLGGKKISDITSKQIAELDATEKFLFAGEKGIKRLAEADDLETKLNFLDIAKRMRSEGMSAKDIKIRTGWEMGSDKMWRYELPETKINFDVTDLLNAEVNGYYYVSASNDFVRKPKFDEVIGEDKNGIKVKLSDTEGAIVYPMEQFIGKGSEFEKAYPELMSIKVYVTTPGSKIAEAAGPGTVGYFDRFNNRIVLNSTAFSSVEDMRSTFFHEVQHAIQVEEGFALGASPMGFEVDEKAAAEAERDLTILMDLYDNNTIARVVINTFPKFGGASDADLDNYVNNTAIKNNIKPLTFLHAINEVTKLIGDYPTRSNYDAAIKRFRSIMRDNDAFALYKRAAGEVESRNVQTRMDMSPLKRRASLMEETADVAKEDRIFLFDQAEQAYKVPAAEIKKENELKKRTQVASERLTELFQRDNVPLTVNEAKEMVKEVIDWADWYDGISDYSNEVFGEYAEDFLSILPLSSMAANSSATVGLTINNIEKIYNNEKPSGVAEYYGYVTDFLQGKGIKSDKMSNFFKALTGDKDAIAVDMHVWSLIMGKDPNKKQVNPKNKEEFDRAKEFVNLLADELNLSPREVQASLWAANILRTGGKPDSYEQYIQQQVESKGLKERIQSWRDKGYKPFSEIRKEREIVKPGISKAAKANVEKTFNKATDLFYKIKGTEGAAKRKALADERKALMNENPSVKFIDDNIKNVLDQLEAKEVATRKGNCP